MSSSLFVERICAADGAFKSIQPIVEIRHRRSRATGYMISQRFQRHRHGVIEIDQDLRTRAGECGYRSIVIALGTVGDLRDPEVLSYEGPFGVGYMVAVLVDRRRQN